MEREEGEERERETWKIRKVFSGLSEIRVQQLSKRA